MSHFFFLAKYVKLVRDRVLIIKNTKRRDGSGTEQKEMVVGHCGEPSHALIGQ